MRTEADVEKQVWAVVLHEEFHREGLEVLGVFLSETEANRVRTEWEVRRAARQKIERDFRLSTVCATRLISST